MNIYILKFITIYFVASLPIIYTTCNQQTLDTNQLNEWNIIGVPANPKYSTCGS
jgi:hypothetical protein